VISRKLAFLTLLYFAQGLPFGFQSVALPVYLYQQGASLGVVGLVGLLALPWAFKALWAPLVDRSRARKPWILAMQVALALSAISAALLPDGELGLWMLCGLVLVMNLFAATQDIATDGLAVDLLAADEVGAGNAAQVVGYKLGMITGGGLLAWASGTIGWSGLFLVMAGLMTAVALVTVAAPERTPRAKGPSPPTLHEILAALLRALRRPGGILLVAFLVVYKLGESASDAMWKPFLVDAGLTAPEIGRIVGTWGMIASVGGSLFGGLLAMRLRLRAALAVALTLRLVSLGLRVWVAWQGQPTVDLLTLTTCVEEIGGGALTTVCFALMMVNVDPRIGATHYTVLATIEVQGKAPGHIASGFLAMSFGFLWVFSAGALLSLLPFLLLPWLATHKSASPPTQAPA
jgi:MFS family permease